jgi:Polyketide cyclase / dehydrase and lipid transport
MLSTIAIIVVAGLAAVLLFAATKPDTFRVERTAGIKAPAEKIYPLINDFHSWESWSPFEKLDPAMKKSYSGPANGLGAVYEWEGNSKAGMGRMEITSTSPSSSVSIKLDFLKPFEGHNTAQFTLQPTGDTTNVTWAMYGGVPYMAKLMTLVFDRDRMIGAMFDEGLANLKARTEG